MRTILALAALSMLTWQPPVRADEAATQEPTATVAADTDEGASDALDDSERPRHPPFDRYNQWVCRARPLIGFRSFFGRSERFPAGSGLGQRAHREAYFRALRRCERFTIGARRCRSDFQNDCWVQRGGFGGGGFP